MEAKFKVGDEVWIIQNEKPSLKKVEDVADNGCTYLVTDNNGHYGWMGENYLFESKIACVHDYLLNPKHK